MTKKQSVKLQSSYTQRILSRSINSTDMLSEKQRNLEIQGHHKIYRHV